MFKPLLRRNLVYSSSVKYLSFSNKLCEKHSCKLLIIGGGSGGITMGSKFARTMKKNELIILEPSDVHYYQPMFTLAGGGIKKVSQSVRSMSSLIPKNATRLQDKVAQFDPENNRIFTKNGDTISYDVMIIAVGLELHYEKIPGLSEAVEKFDNVGSIYSPKYAEKTYKALQKFKGGNAVFTYPQSYVKCPGAPQKICYIGEDYLRKVGKRDKATVIYNTSLPVLFGVKHYCNALWKVVKKRDIQVNTSMNLVEVKPDKNLAIFQNLDTLELKTFEYEMLHAVPPMCPPGVVRNSTKLVNEAGYVNVDQSTLQHVHYPNIFAIGDCSSSPNSKTTAAIASQAPVIYNNIKAVLEGRKLTSQYDGYASCPLVTGYGKCILAEFDYSLTPKETFPISQDKELWMMYIMKKDFMPLLYWHLMLPGYWNGPAILRKLLSLGFR